MITAIAHLCHTLGSYTLAWCRATGSYVLLFYRALAAGVTGRCHLRDIITQLATIGVDSLPIVLLTGLFSGMVFTLQSYIGFSRLGGQQFIGAVVALGMARELGPVMTGLMVTGRATSSMAAQLGTMRITEQLDALWTLRIDNMNFLLAPRIIASCIALPMLSLCSTACGILGGYSVIRYVLALNPTEYMHSLTLHTHFYDILCGLIKATVFGAILSTVGCYKGYYTQGGARGVGNATTQAVVVSSVLILITNYIITKLLDTL